MMRMILSFLAIWVLAVGGAQAQGAAKLDLSVGEMIVAHKLEPLAMRATGRMQVVPAEAALPSGSKAYSHQWPGVYFETQFHGETLTLRFDDPTNVYHLLIDDASPIRLEPKAAREMSISGLGSGTHHARLERVSENQDHRGVFSGFYAPKSTQVALDPPRPRQIEFIGDSNMLGYGILSSTHECSTEVVFATTDVTRAYPVLSAKAAGADYQIQAISGRGMIRNWQGELPGQTLPDIYPFVFLDQQVPVGETGWRPQVIVLQLGDNDFSTPLEAGERWASRKAFLDDYIETYQRFMGVLYAKHPKAALLISWPNLGQLTPDEVTWLNTIGQDQLRARAKALGFSYSDILPLMLKEPEASACHFHMSARDHKAVAARLDAYLAAHPELWLKTHGR
ncbi:SGNH/GDSL hydrolase family protein [Candidatus Phycosocius spiralis]|uniref:Lipase n=1 Tax=Candidatus Phycosocius spiralis TaxID=2815099 RepID=A0ABQ4PXT0_9PROT|nr:SGNH/GDSL hydrolase family protein [Candidatus Phycosocius spiralis]GIU67890.1 lipase [Candidatus Phycosocius spiralis]